MWSRVVRWWGFSLVVTMSGLPACSSGPAGSHRRALVPPSEKTIVGPGDVFTMDIVGEKDLPREFQVASDGTVDLPFVHTLQVAGLEPQGIARLVRQTLIDKKILNDPSVIVQVKEYNSRSVVVLGQVAKPGTFPLTSGLTLIQAISLSGGLTSIANEDRVTLTRKVGNKTQTVVLSVEAITSGDSEDIPLQAGDRIYVHERIF
jgi:protein involved in polysaccharide export with SLBB domain